MEDAGLRCMHGRRVGSPMRTLGVYSVRGIMYKHYSAVPLFIPALLLVKLKLSVVLPPYRLARP